MKLLFKGSKSFLMIFLCILFIDLVFTNTDYLYKYRYATKIWITITLIIHFFYNNSGLVKRDRILGFCALLFSFLADVILITDKLIFVVAGMFLFILTKICYSIIYSYRTKFDIDRLLPFLAVTLLYCLFIMYFLYEGIGKLYIPVVLYTFISVVMTKMAYLRYKRVSTKSYRFVFLGAILFIISETSMSFYNFYKPLPYTNTTVLLTYGLSQYFSIRGILLQNEPKN